jgi:hypothetical protein
MDFSQGEVDSFIKRRIGGIAHTDEKSLVGKEAAATSSNKRCT